MDRNIFAGKAPYMENAVALRKESVDRNFGLFNTVLVLILSLSARRAWIEMPWLLSSVSDSLVALRKESVDRNIKSSDR